MSTRAAVLGAASACNLSGAAPPIDHSQLSAELARVGVAMGPRPVVLTTNRQQDRPHDRWHLGLLDRVEFSSLKLLVLLSFLRLLDFFERHRMDDSRS
jgi:hypothetical protein